MGGTDRDRPRAPSKRIVVKKIKMTRKRGSARTGGNSNIAKKKPKKSLAIGGGTNNTDALPKPSKKAATASFGLPSFRFEVKPPKLSWTKQDNELGEDNSSSPLYPHDDDVSDEEIPSDTLIAMNSLIQSDQGLHVPITNNGSVQVILESQIYSIFDETHASNVNAELLEMIHTNKVQRMFCQDMSAMAFMRTEDYVKAVWDSHGSITTPKLCSRDEEIVSWFLAQLHNWTKASISESSLVEGWEGKTETNNNTTEDSKIESNDVVRYLLHAQFLIRDPKQNLSGGGGNREDSYFLWLPNWGIVLKSWNEARQQLLTLLALRKEMSKANVLEKNRHSCISTNFLLNELLSKEKIRVVERPFGSFIQLAKD